MAPNRKLHKALEDHPLSGELADAALRAWKTIFSSTIGSLAVGKDWFPSPQLIGMFLHELVPVEVERMHPGEWRRDRTSSEKDVVCVNNEALSVEIKTSSSTKGIFGNRSVGQKLAGTRPPKKNKSGFVLAINFDKPREGRESKIRLGASRRTGLG